MDFSTLITTPLQLIGLIIVIVSIITIVSSKEKTKTIEKLIYIWITLIFIYYFICSTIFRIF